jgi:hypothetical protein
MSSHCLRETAGSGAGSTGGTAGQGSSREHAALSRAASGGGAKLRPIVLRHDLSARQVDLLLAGGVINLLRDHRSG